MRGGFFGASRQYKAGPSFSTETALNAKGGADIGALRIGSQFYTNDDDDNTDE